MITLTLGDDTPLGTNPDGSRNTAEDRFVGFTHAGGITGFSVTSGTAGDWELDELQWGRMATPPSVVPLPALGAPAHRRPGRARPPAPPRLTVQRPGVRRGKTASVAVFAEHPRHVARPRTLVLRDELVGRRHAAVDRALAR
jgi:hypothetical protein